jgi:nucleoside triphosphate pyrophosphatase
LTIILASTSPRRYQILSLLQLPFLMVPPQADETSEVRWAAKEEAARLAQRKAASVAGLFPTAVIVGSDTLIDLGGQKIGKPGGRADARRILERLRACAHEVITAVTILHQQSGRSFEWVQAVRVTMRGFSEPELEAYVASDEPLDKAGAYSLQGQGRLLIAGLEGDYLAAVGLPLRVVANGLQQMGIAMPVNVDRIYQERNVFNWRTFAE